MINIYVCDLEYKLDVWCFPGSLPIGALLLVRVESPISHHTAVLLGCVKPRCPRRFCRRGGDVIV